MDFAEEKRTVRVLIVEDEVRLAQHLKKALQTLPSFAVDLSHDGEDGQFMAETNDYDLVVLDLMLPERDGLTVLKNLREAGRRVPVLILTARRAKEDIIQGLDYGSDDYLTKPFDMGEFLARCKALIRRRHGQPEPILQVHDLIIDTRSHTVRRGGKAFFMPALQYRLLEYLAYRQGAVVSKTELLEHLYDYNWEKFSNVIEHYIYEIRRRIDEGFDLKLLHTIRGHGYVLRGSAPCGDGLSDSESCS
jgi:two-component system response regulator PhoP